LIPLPRGREFQAILGFSAAIRDSRRWILDLRLEFLDFQPGILDLSTRIRDFYRGILDFSE
jgi:hypothetical protein